MEGIVALTVLLFAFHVLVIAYLYRSISARRDGERADGDGSSEFDRFGRSDDDGVRAFESRTEDPSVSGSISCPVCGAPNDPTFQFCRRCVSDLSEGSARRGDRFAGQPGQ